MAKTTTPQVVRSYLSQLKDALAGVPAEVRDEIVAGVREELDGLDAAAAAARIETLGDPEFIAAEARAEANLAAAEPATEPIGTRSREPRWFAVLASLLIAFGGLVIPVIGWVVGLALMWMSSAWTRREKAVATFMPLVIGFLVTAVATVVRMWSGGVHGGGLDGFNNPLFPTFFDSIWSVLILLVLINAVVGIWLLWRAKAAWSSGEQMLPKATRPPAPDPRPRQPAGWHPIVTVMLLIVGGYLIPVIGWVLGVVMLWASTAWTRRQKWLGTLAGPAGMAGGFLAAVVTQPVHGFDNLLWWNAMLLGGLVLPFVANLLVGIHLLRNRVG